MDKCNGQKDRDSAAGKIAGHTMILGRIGAGKISLALAPLGSLALDAKPDLVRNASQKSKRGDE